MIISRVVLLWVCLIASVNKFKESNAVEAFVPTPIFHASFSKSRRLSVLITPLGRPLSLSASSSSSSSSGGSTTNDGTEVDKLPRPNEKEVQWDLFCRYHAKGSSTSWRGNWITYNYLGDVEDSSLASVVYEKQQDGNDVRVTQLHQIVTDATQSTCSTCFDSENVHTFPVAQYTPQSLRRLRLASVRPPFHSIRQNDCVCMYVCVCAWFSLHVSTDSSFLKSSLWLSLFLCVAFLYQYLY